VKKIILITVSIKKRRMDKHELINSMNVSSPVALALTGATAMPSATNWNSTLTSLDARTGASSAASGKMPGKKSRFLIDLIPKQPSTALAVPR
jgi:hypothetical protein